MGKSYKLFQGLGYEALNHSFNKGKKIDDKRINNQNLKRHKEQMKIINHIHTNRHNDKQWDLLFDEVRKFEFYEDIDKNLEDDDEYFF